MSLHNRDGDEKFFSPALTLAGMDYIAPSAECIKPTLIRTQEQRPQEPPSLSSVVQRHRGGRRHRSDNVAEGDSIFSIGEGNHTPQHADPDRLEPDDARDGANVSVMHGLLGTRHIHHTGTPITNPDHNTSNHYNHTSHLSQAPPSTWNSQDASRAGVTALPSRREVIKITLQDCLACSGCVTTAETVLLNAQSRHELLRAHRADAKRPWLITISEPSAASLAAYAGVSMREAYALVAGFMRAMLSRAACDDDDNNEEEDDQEKVKDEQEKVEIAAPESHTSGKNDEEEKNNEKQRADLSASDTHANAELRDSSSCVSDSVQSNDWNSAPTPTTTATATTTAATTTASASAALDMDSHTQNATHHHETRRVYVADLTWATQLSAHKTAEEYMRWYRSEPTRLPMLVSACPGWVCYCEKQGATLLPHLCPVLSPQGLAGSLAKRALSRHLYHVSIQPCFDRKLESVRDGFVSTSAEMPAIHQEAPTQRMETNASACHVDVDDTIPPTLPTNTHDRQASGLGTSAHSTRTTGSTPQRDSLQRQHETNTVHEAIANETRASTESSRIDTEVNPSDVSPAFIPYTDCVLSTAELLEWMCEVDARLPWRGALNSCADGITTDEEEDNTELTKTNDGATTAHESARSNATNTTTTSCSLPSAQDVALWRGSGGYHREAIHHGLRAAQGERTAALPAAAIDYEVRRNRNHQLVRCEDLPGHVFCIAYGFQQIQNVVRSLRKRLASVRRYTMVECMACPGGCLNGGGQVVTAGTTHEARLAQTERKFADYIAASLCGWKEASDATSALRYGQGAAVGAGAADDTRCRNSEALSSEWEEGEVWFTLSRMSALLERCGAAAWTCTFRDRQREFEEMLNEGKVHSLKW